MSGLSIDEVADSLLLVLLFAGAALALAPALVLYAIVAIAL